MFGASSTPNPFVGGATSPASSSSTSAVSNPPSNVFGSISSGTPGISAFSSEPTPAPAFGSSNVFGSSVTSASGSFANPFSAATPISSSSTAALTSAFGAKPAKSMNPFGQDAKSAMPATSNAFGGATSTRAFGSSTRNVFEGSKQTENIFGNVPTSSSAGNTQPAFGATTKSAGDNISVFVTSSKSSSQASSNVFGGKAFSPPATPANSPTKFGGTKSTQGETTTASSTFSGRSVFGGAAGESRNAPARAFGTTSKGSSGVFGRKSSAVSDFAKKAREGESQERKRNLRRRSNEDVSNKVAIVVSRIPPQAFMKFALKTHFSKFGEVKRIYMNNEKKKAIVHFANHKSAEKALKEGAYILRDHPKMVILWGKHNPKPDSKVADDVEEELEGASSAPPGSVFSRVERKPRRDFKELTTLLKSRSVSPEPHRSASPSSRSEKPGAAHITLKGVGGSAHTTQERVAILENRDKILRQSDQVQGKHADLATAKALIGTCPDMCPELERYLREVRHRLHRYETINGTSEADHSRVVKEYSRSSADQGMPLPLEVRPGPVLHVTMDYLLGHIMDKGQDGSWYDWYDFLWNRMRSIRKDITQQHLCDRTAVDLVQKCVRFHVYCAHRLCEEDLGTFDQKINDENLTKCLQTLKEFYEDLGSQGVAPDAEEEAEFRAYIVLMNLNQGDVLREVQTFRREVRESSSMRFVVAVFSALNSHNFVRFFRYVRQAPFLMASVMHRYFGQVRNRALTVITRAYKERIPLSKFVDQLAFEDENEAAQFCMHHGLSVDGGCVQTEKARFIQPENVFPQKRAIRVIESKQNGSIGDVVNGRPLERKPPPTPSSSFDSSGNFVGGKILIHQEKRAPPTEEPKIQPAQPKQQPPIQPAHSEQSEHTAQPAAVVKPQAPPIQYSNETVKDLTKELCREVIDEMLFKIVDPLTRAIKLYLSQDKALTDALLKETIDPQCKQVAEDVHKEMMRQAEIERKARMQALQAHEKAQSKKRATDCLVEDILQETLTSEIKSCATQQIDAVVKQLTDESECRVTQRISDVLLSETTIAMCGSLANEVFQSDVIDRLQNLDDAEHTVKVRRTATFFFAWKKRLAERIRLHRSMMTFPPAPSTTPLSSQLKLLLPQSEGIQGDGIHLGGSAFLTTLPLSRIQVSDMRLSLEVSVHHCAQMLRRERAWRPLDVAGMLEPSAKQRLRTYPNHETALQWKLIISSNVNDEVTEWLKAKLSKGAVDSDDLLSLYSSQLANTEANIGVCIRCVEDIEEEDRSLLGAQALLFIVNEQDLAHSRQRLHFLVDARPLKPAVPLLLLHSSSITDAGSSLGLSSLLSSNRISGWKSVVIPSDIEAPEASDNLSSGLVWLCDKWPQPVVITRKALREVVEDQVGRRYFNPVSQNLTKLRSQGKLDQDPRLLCELYNSVITHLSVALSHVDLQDYSIPIPEFQPQDKDWNTICQLKDLRDFLLSLRLPMFVHSERDSDDWGDACVTVYKWLRNVTDQAPALYSRVRWLLKKAEEDFEDLCLLQMQLDKCKPSYVNVPWTEIINACIEHHLGSFNYTEENEVYVYYLKSHLDHFRPPSSWLSADLDESQSEIVNIGDSFVRAAKKRLADASPDEFLRPKVRRNFPLLPTLSPLEKETQDMGHQLETSIKISQQEGQEYEEYLAKVLEEDSNQVILTQFGEVMNSDPETEEQEEAGMSILEEFNEKKLSLMDGLDLLNDSLVSQKNAGIMYELKLQRMLNDSI